MSAKIYNFVEEVTARKRQNYFLETLENAALLVKRENITGLVVILRQDVGSKHPDYPCVISEFSVLELSHVLTQLQTQEKANAKSR